MLHSPEGSSVNVFSQSSWFSQLLSVTSGGNTCGHNNHQGDCKWSIEYTVPPRKSSVRWQARIASEVRPRERLFNLLLSFAGLPRMKGVFRVLLRSARLDALPIRLRIRHLLGGGGVELDKIDAGKQGLLVFECGFFVLRSGTGPETQFFEVDEQAFREALFGLDGFLDVAHEDGALLGVVGFAGH